MLEVKVSDMYCKLKKLAVQWKSHGMSYSVSGRLNNP